MESDEELMDAVARGDERALGALVERHAAGLHAHLVRSCGSRDDAEDLLQETWVRVARGARTYRAGRPVRPWLHGIAANLANDLWRRRAVRRRLLREAPPEPPARGLAALDGLALRERVARLPERSREVLWLRFYAGLDEAEMAEALAIPRGTVKSRLHGAIRALRDGWEDAS
jgi:RNA polymerase sigma-70 factor (ECF subfamily)